MLKYQTNRIGFTECVFEDSQENDRSITLWAKSALHVGYPKIFASAKRLLKKSRGSKSASKGENGTKK